MKLSDTGEEKSLAYNIERQYIFTAVLRGCQGFDGGMKRETVSNSDFIRGIAGRGPLILFAKILEVTGIRDFLRASL